MAEGAAGGLDETLLGIEDLVGNEDFSFAVVVVEAAVLEIVLGTTGRAAVASGVSFTIGLTTDFGFSKT